MTRQMGSPPQCGVCGHTVRDGETYEDRMWGTNSRGPVPGVAHTPICPTDLPTVLVPRAPCLAQRLARQVTAPHPCQGRTPLRIVHGQIVVAPEQECPCRCRRVLNGAPR